MPPQKNDILQGTLVLLVLKTLAVNRRMHGYAITTHIQRVSDDLLRELSWAHVDEVLRVQVPFDARHNAKVDYPTLKERLAAAAALRKPRR